MVQFLAPLLITNPFTISYYG